MNRTRMAISTVDDVVRFVGQMSMVSNPLSVVWHAGEPLVTPIPFYEQAFERFEAGSPPVPAQHNFQTNATLLNDDWCRFIKRSSVRIGVSIDGPKHIHDAYRVDRSGRGTFDKVMRGIEKLREHDIPFGTISVITRTALGQADEICEFLASLGSVRVCFNLEEAEGAHRHSTLDDEDLRAQARRFFARAAELLSGTRKVTVREIENMQHHLSAPPGNLVMRGDNRPGAILNVDVAGNVTTLSPELLGQFHPTYGEFIWANVHKDTWSSVLQNPDFLHVMRDIETGIEQCSKSCGYFAVCGGGNPSNKLTELGTLAGTETQQCRLHVQAVADVLLDLLENAQLAARTSPSTDVIQCSES